MAVASLGFKLSVSCSRAEIFFLASLEPHFWLTSGHQWRENQKRDRVEDLSDVENNVCRCKCLLVLRGLLKFGGSYPRKKCPVCSEEAIVKAGLESKPSQHSPYDISEEVLHTIYTLVKPT